MIIPTLPYQVTPVPGIEQSGATMESGSGPDVIDTLIVKESCKKDKTERNFLLPEVDIHDISTLKDLKFYLTHKLPIRKKAVLGTLLEEARRCGFTPTVSFKSLSILIKGKGALWCDCVMQSTCNDDDVNPDKESANNNYFSCCKEDKCHGNG